MVMRTEFSHGTCGVQNPVQQPPNSRAVGIDRGRAAMRWPPAPVRRLAIALALKAERVLTKREIMADYLSIITTGYGLRGVTAAACAYYRAPLRELSIAQYALLAGVTQAPSLYDPTIDPEAAQQRRAQVLAAMVADHYITAAQAQTANAEPVLDRGPGRPGC